MSPSGGGHGGSPARPQAKTDEELSEIVLEAPPVSSAPPPSRPPSRKPPRPKPSSKMSRQRSYHLPHPSTLLTAKGSSGASGTPGLTLPWLALLGVGVITLMILHDALQALQYKQEGFSHGLVSSCLAQAACSVAAGVAIVLLRKFGPCLPPVGSGDDPSGKGNLTRPLLANGGRYGAESRGEIFNLFMYYLALAATMNASLVLCSTALSFANHPVKTLFKAMKLMPTLVLATFFNNAVYVGSDYAIGALTCAGLMTFAAGDFTEGPRATSAVAPILLTVAVVLDGVCPNLQENLLKRLGRSKSEIVMASCGLSSAMILLYVGPSGDLVAAWSWYKGQPSWHPLGLLGLQAVVAYFGLVLYLLLINHAGSKVAVITTSCRRTAVGVMALLLMLKSANWKHMLGFALVAAGLACFAKFGSPDKPPARRPGSGRIIDVAAILGPSLGRLGLATGNTLRSSLERVNSMTGRAAARP